MFVINYLNDKLLKNIFNELRANLLLELINSVLEDKGLEQISNITYKDREIDPDFFKSKTSVVDLYVETSDNLGVNTEFQDRKITDYLKRSYLYNIRLADRLKEGEDFSKLNRTVGIHFINFDLPDFQWTEEYHECLFLSNLKDVVVKNLTEMHFINIRAWRRLNRDVLRKTSKMSKLSKWTAFFCNSLKKVERKELIRSDPMLMQAANATKDFFLKSENRVAYIKAEIDKMTEESEKRVAREEGWKDGLEEGRKEGWKEGLEEGRKESKVIVQNLLSKKYSKAEIHELTGLSVEKIEEYAC
ncbi:MAG: Rpn family recombination-promoting nuclease/putative transposase [Desulfovibrionaceae bacterium]|nr:Rpn family recombination-promoting nuclease/putative transposase [Desulfovibrionaceae bacterium]